MNIDERLELLTLDVKSLVSDVKSLTTVAISDTAIVQVFAVEEKQVATLTKKGRPK